jgi:hypothetical protein
MHKMKEEVIMRIFAQESPKSKLRLKNMAKRSYRDLFGIFGKWLGVYLEIFLKSGVFMYILGTAA